MNILPYYVIHTTINSIKKLFKTWVAVFIAVCFAIGVIAGIIGVAVGSHFEESANEITDTEEFYEEENDELILDEEIKPEPIVRGLILLITLAVILFSIYGGDKSGTKIFTMPDVNFLFASPLSPQSVLMFRTVLQMGVAVISSLYLLFQIPNTVNAGLNVKTSLSILLCYGFLLYISRLASILTYTITATHTKFRKIVKPCVITVIFLILAAFYVYTKASGTDYISAAVTIFSKSSLNYIPVVGWFSGVIFSAYNNNLVSFLIYTLLILVFCIISTLLIWKIKADFYEDALNNAVKTQEILQASQNGDTVKRKKDRSQKIKRNEDFIGEGAFLFFYKTVYNRKRFSKFGLFTPTSVTYSLISLSLTFVLSLIADLKTVLPLGFVILACIFFRNMGNPLADEMLHPFIFTVPESPYKKVYFSLFGSIYEAATDMLPCVIIATVCFPNMFLKIFLWYLLWISFDIFCSATGLFIEFVLPDSLTTAIKAMFGLLIKMLSIVPSLILLIANVITGSWIFIIIAVILNLLLSAIMLWISPCFLLSGKK